MVLVYADDEQLAYELLGKGREIADELKVPLKAVVISGGQEKEYINHGADKVFVVESSLKNFKVEEYSDMLSNIIKEAEAKVILIGGDKNGRELASRLAAQLNAGCVTDCINISLDGNTILAEKVVYGGNAIAKYRFLSQPSIVTIPPRTYDALPAEEREGEVIRKKIDTKEYPSKIVNVEKKKAESINVEAAEIIVSCGRGLKKKEDIQQIEELAKVLKATVGCSRPIAADLKWLSEDHWIGLSGHKVKPKLYIALGISGQIQHIAGMRDSDIVVAVNKDADAPIFKMADYGIVGDIYEVIPLLTKEFKEKLGG